MSAYILRGTLHSWRFVLAGCFTVEGSQNRQLCCRFHSDNEEASGFETRSQQAAHQLRAAQCGCSVISCCREVHDSAHLRRGGSAESGTMLFCTWTPFSTFSSLIISCARADSCVQYSQQPVSQPYLPVYTGRRLPPVACAGTAMLTLHVSWPKRICRNVQQHCQLCIHRNANRCICWQDIYLEC